MNEINSIQQMNKVIRVLEEKRSIEEKLNLRLNAMIEKKKMFIDKMKKYKNDYDAMNGIRLSHKVPSLLQNLKKFLHKMDESILSEEKSIQALLKEQEIIQLRILEINQKMKAVEILISKYEKKSQRRIEIREDDALESLINSQYKGAL